LGFFVMAINPVTPPEWPKPDIEIEAAIGRFIIAWNVLEREIDRAIEELYDLDYDLAWSITANLGTKAKLDIFQSGFHILHEYFQECDPADIDRLVADTANASGQIRTAIIHGQPSHLIMQKETWDVWIKLRARKGGVRGPMFRLNKSRFDADTKKVRSILDRWNQLRETMIKGREFREFTKKA
jgi:hypothetical protein